MANSPTTHTPGQPPIPPTQVVSNFALAYTAQEVLLSLAQSRTALVDNGNSTITPQVLQEWFLTLSMSPSSAKVLSSFLLRLISTYEEKYGKIVDEPNMQLKEN